MNSELLYWAHVLYRCHLSHVSPNSLRYHESISLIIPVQMGMHCYRFFVIWHYPLREIFCSVFKMQPDIHPNAIAPLQTLKAPEILQTHTHIQFNILTFWTHFLSSILFEMHQINIFMDRCYFSIQSALNMYHIKIIRILNIYNSNRNHNNNNKNSIYYI